MLIRISVGGVQIWQDMGPACAPNIYAPLQVFLAVITKEETNDDELPEVQDLQKAEALISNME